MTSQKSVQYIIYGVFFVVGAGIMGGFVGGMAVPALLSWKESTCTVTDYTPASRDPEDSDYGECSKVRFKVDGLDEELDIGNSRLPPVIDAESGCKPDSGLLHRSFKCFYDSSSVSSYSGPESSDVCFQESSPPPTDSFSISFGLGMGCGMGGAFMAPCIFFVLYNTCKGSHCCEGAKRRLSGLNWFGIVFTVIGLAISLGVSLGISGSTFGYWDSGTCRVAEVSTRTMGSTLERVCDQVTFLLPIGTNERESLEASKVSPRISDADCRNETAARELTRKCWYHARKSSSSSYSSAVCEYSESSVSYSISSDDFVVDESEPDLPSSATATRGFAFGMGFGNGGPFLLIGLCMLCPGLCKKMKPSSASSSSTATASRARAASASHAARIRTALDRRSVRAAENPMAQAWSPAESSQPAASVVPPMHGGPPAYGHHPQGGPSNLWAATGDSPAAYMPTKTDYEMPARQAGGAEAGAAPVTHSGWTSTV